jgi:hypothetical protein
LTAGSHGVTLVTSDKGLTARARGLGIEVLHPQDLLAELGCSGTEMQLLQGGVRR